MYDFLTPTRGPVKVRFDNKVEIVLGFLPKKILIPSLEPLQQGSSRDDNKGCVQWKPVYG